MRYAAIVHTRNGSSRVSAHLVPGHTVYVLTVTCIVFTVSALLVYFSYSVRYSKLNNPTRDVNGASADGDRVGLLDQDETEDEM